MRSKRTSARRRRDRPAERAAGHEGLVLDWMGLQATGGGAVSGWLAGLVAALLALRAAPYLAGQAGRRVARRP